MAVCFAWGRINRARHARRRPTLSVSCGGYVRVVSSATSLRVCARSRGGPQEQATVVSVALRTKGSSCVNASRSLLFRASCGSPWSAARVAIGGAC